MTKEEAYRIICPATFEDEIRKIEKEEGAKAARDKLTRAMLIAASCILKCMEMEDDGK